MLTHGLCPPPPVLKDNRDSTKKVVKSSQSTSMTLGSVSDKNLFILFLIECHALLCI